MVYAFCTFKVRFVRTGRISSAELMLVELGIKNFAIIDNLSLSFGPGLNIFTGETGAGKSIVIDAISLILGDRATNELIRAEAEEAEVEALFDVSGVKGLAEIIEEAGIVPSVNLIIKRVVQRAGRNKIYINGSLATLVTLTEVGRRLIDIYGQSDHQSLTRPEEHIEVLDSFAGLNDLRVEMACAYRDYIKVKRELEGFTRYSKSTSEKKEYLEHISKEIAAAALTPGEEKELKGVMARLKNSEKIKAATVGAEAAIYSESDSVIERLGGALKPLKEIAHLDDKLAKTIEAIESAVYSLEDAASFLRDYSELVEYDSELHEHIGSRLDLINRLIKKYGPTVEDVLKRKEEADSELSGLTDYDGKLSELEGQLKEATDKAVLVSNKLTEERKKASATLKAKIEEELKDLGMAGTVFEVLVDLDVNPDSTPRIGERGADRVVFYISPNPGEEVKPLSRIASGGELSRIMLAMKRVTAAGRVPTLIFDEIDTGVGGAMAQVVGLKLHEVSTTHQVLCVTHLPQIAAFAKKHYAVAKGLTKEKRTVTSIKELEGDRRLEHIAFMLGGMQVTDTSKKHAVELLDAANKLSREGRSDGGSGPR